MTFINLPHLFYFIRKLKSSTFQPKRATQSDFRDENILGFCGSFTNFFMKHCHFLQEIHGSNGNNKAQLIFQLAAFCIQLHTVRQTQARTATEKNPLAFCLLTRAFIYLFNSSCNPQPAFSVGNLGTGKGPMRSAVTAGSVLRCLLGIRAERRTQPFWNLTANCSICHLLPPLGNSAWMAHSRRLYFVDGIVHELYKVIQDLHTHGSQQRIITRVCKALHKCEAAHEH